MNLDNWDLSKSSGSNVLGGIFLSSSLETVSTKNWIIPSSFIHGFFRTMCGRSIKTLDVTGWDLSNTTNVQGLFADGSNLTSLIGLNTWNVSNITDMSQLFYNDSKLTTLDLSSWDMSNVSDTSIMFNGCSSVTTAYAKTQTDADIFNASSGKPATFTFSVKS